MDDEDIDISKRKIHRQYFGGHQVSSPYTLVFHDDPLALSLSPPSKKQRVPSPSPPPPRQLLIPTPLSLPPPPFTAGPSARQELGPSRTTRTRRNPTQAPHGGKSETIPAPFPWATTHRATVHSLKELFTMGIFTISGDVQCKSCEHKYVIEYNLQSKFTEVASYVVANKNTMHNRAPRKWMSPDFPTCEFCDQVNSVKPVLPQKKRLINWLFLLLGEMLGCCTLEYLKYFCKHTKNHRTGAKDRVLYLTYLDLCKQLDPTGPFDR